MEFKEDKEEEFEIDLRVRVAGYGKKSHRIKIAQIVKKTLEVSFKQPIQVLLVMDDNQFLLVQLTQSLNDLHLDSEITAEKLAHRIGHYYGITPEELFGLSRSRHIIMPRQLAMYGVYTLTPYSYPAVGKLFHRDHTTVIHGVQKISQMIANDPEFAKTVEIILTTVQLESYDPNSSQVKLPDE